MYVARFESAIEDFEAIIGSDQDNGAARVARGFARKVPSKLGGEDEGQAVLPLPPSRT